MKRLLFLKARGCSDCERLKTLLAEAGWQGVENLTGRRSVHIRREGIEVLCLDIDTVDGFAEAAYHNVRSTPTLVIEGTPVVGNSEIIAAIMAAGE